MVPAAMRQQANGTEDAYAGARSFLVGSRVAPAFAARAIARIEAEDGELGLSFLATPMRALIRELREESEDAAAWAALLAQRLDHDGGDAATRRRARAMLVTATQRACEADAIIGALSRLLIGKDRR